MLVHSGKNTRSFPICADRERGIAGIAENVIVKLATGAQGAFSNRTLLRARVRRSGVLRLRRRSADFGQNDNEFCRCAESGLFLQRRFFLLFGGGNGAQRNVFALRQQQAHRNHRHEGGHPDQHAAAHRQFVLDAEHFVEHGNRR